ncbi:MAG: hypothetical protein HYX72_02110 [Acidobacteria bacterium]|nr:hypothetical protein [Acidobacteriota bacterium]
MEEVIELASRSESIQHDQHQAAVHGACGEITHSQQRVRLQDLGRAAALLSHELRQPLGAIQNLTSYARACISHADKPVLESLCLVEQQAELASRILSSLSSFARSGQPARSPVQLHRILYNVLDRTARPQEIALQKHLVSPLPTAMADPLHVDRIVSNLIANALESIDGPGTVTITTRAEYELVILQISDTGCGIEPGLAESIFQPFVTTKRNGTGLGLALSCELAQANGGSLSFTSSPGKGTTFELRLPQA